MLHTLANTMDGIWPGSYKVLEGLSVVSEGGAGSFTDAIANVCIVVPIIIFFLLGLVRITDGLQIVLSGAVNYRNLLKIEEHASLYTSRNTLLTFLVFVFSFMMANCNLPYIFVEETGEIWIRFLTVILFFILYFVYRQVVSALLNWVNRCKVFRYITKIYYTYTALALLLAISGFSLYMLFPGIGESFLNIYLLCSLSVIAVTCFVRGNQIIISNGFSHFFWILYLCTLEILPLVVLWHIIVS